MGTVEPDEDDADKQRQTIVAKYDRGYQKDKLEEWEDASYIVYRVTDRYGFMHKDPLTDDFDAKLLIQERERELKWKKMVEKWDKYSRSEKLRRRIYKGIPDSMRASVWTKLLELDRIPNKTALYQEFRAQARLYSPDIRQIDLDVNRTYRDHIMFRDRYGTKQQDLFHVLAAYSMYNQEVGYCQGMSGIAALLLMYLNEQDAFWALSVLITNSQKHSMHGFFIPGFPKLKRFQDHHETILKKQAPKLFKHLEKEGVHTTLYTLKWFMQCFLDRTPFPLTLRLWDVFLLEGDKILTAMAYNLMKIHKKKFVKQPMEDIVQFLQEQMSNYPYNIDQMMELLQESRFELRKGGLESPPAPSSQEFPRQAPGSSLKRGTFETASARARKSKQKDMIIEIPPGKPLSPELPASGGGNKKRSGNDARDGMRRPMSRSSSSRRSESSGSRSDSFRSRQEMPEVRYGSPESHLGGSGFSAYNHAHPAGEVHLTSSSESRLPPLTEPHSDLRSASHTELPDGPARVSAVLSSAEVARFNQNLKNSYLRSQQLQRNTSGRRLNGSHSAPLERMRSPSTPVYSEHETSESDRSRAYADQSTLTMSLPGSVNLDRGYGPPTGRSPGPSTGSSSRYSNPATPVRNGDASLAHAPVWQKEGPEGSMQFTLTAASNRQMTFV